MQTSATLAELSLEEQAAVRKVTPGLSPELVLGRVARRWMIVDGRFPFPRWDVRCPGCGGTSCQGAVQLSRISYGLRPHSQASTYRADVMFKCTDCSLAFTHGVPIPAEVYDAALGTHPEGRSQWEWREVRAALPPIPRIRTKPGGG